MRRGKRAGETQSRIPGLPTENRKTRRGNRGREWCRGGARPSDAMEEQEPGAPRRNRGGEPESKVRVSLFQAEAVRAREL
ncbi:hypothetical protein GUJ93_ZPchr0002g24375 [Zizania palustris]|uniref:Uncharacterized protein n=1 Tax=Zizania palustris TaxID=103762 RepID=A0A8J5SQW8_ZIZPA|nr:hypothetical protein GUJ93_ZPchr0002g24375 [Zizania palustris]